MSVRREAVGEHSAGGSGLMKSALFWVSMMTASFLLGFLVFAPLMQMVKSRGESNSASPAQQTNSGPRPSTASNRASSAPQPKTLVVEPDEPVSITPDRSSVAEGEIQPASDPTETPIQAAPEVRRPEPDGESEPEARPSPEQNESPAPGRAERSERSGRSGPTERETPAEESGRRRETDRSDRTRPRNPREENEAGNLATSPAPRRSERGERAVRSERSTLPEQPSASIDGGERSTSAAVTERRAARTSRRPTDERAGDRRPSRVRDGDDVQKSEGIDR
jgi:hypothetical protein